MIIFLYSHIQLPWCNHRLGAEFHCWVQYCDFSKKVRWVGKNDRVEVHVWMQSQWGGPQRLRWEWEWQRHKESDRKRGRGSGRWSQWSGRLAGTCGVGVQGSSQSFKRWGLKWHSYWYEKFWSISLKAAGRGRRRDRSSGLLNERRKSSCPSIDFERIKHDDVYREQKRSDWVSPRGRGTRRAGVSSASLVSEEEGGHRRREDDSSR